MAAGNREMAILDFNVSTTEIDVTKPDLDFNVSTTDLDGATPNAHLF